jgi:N-ethylmaleimide reductase
MNISNVPLFRPVTLGDLELSNRIVMAPMTRSRIDNPGLVPGQLQAQYYSQRASAGLIITEACWPSRGAIGALNVPGIFNGAQAEGWRQVTDAVHAVGGHIYVQIGHVGGASHPDHLGGELPLAPSAVNPQQKSFTPNGFKDTVTPRAMSLDDIQRTIADYAKATAFARQAGFDGIELHASNVYLIPEFLSDHFNQRTDSYGGNPENRSRFVVEILRAMIAEWSSRRVGIRLSPGFKMGGFGPTPQTLPTYEYLVAALSDLHLSHLHLVHTPVDLADTPLAAFNRGTAAHFRRLYHGTLIANGGFTFETANAAVESGDAELISFATSYIANPDLVQRFARGTPLAGSNRETYYQGGAVGYIDYPAAV